MPKNKQILMICIFLTVATLMVFWWVNNCDFFIFDDQDYVMQNAHIKKGLTMDNIRWAFTTGAVSNWHPLTWISHMLDVQLFGLKPRWHHITNLLFHVANTLLLFFVLRRMTKALWESAFVAALFALHPLHVESVAWVAERKDVLSAFFWILTMGAYCSYVEDQRLKKYLIVVLFFALGLMSKPMLVTLPFVLLLLDYWPLQRFQQTPSDQKINSPVSGDTQKGRSKKQKRRTAREEAKAEMPAGPGRRWALFFNLLYEKIPLFALTVLSCIVTYIVQEEGGAVRAWPLSVRISNAFVSYIAYIEKMIWPTDLAFLYPLSPSLPAWQVLGAVFLVIGITVMVIWKAEKIPYATVGWLWYAGTLVPVIGIVQVGFQSRADRYTYIPLIGLFIIVAWGISEFSKNWRYRKQVLFASSLAVLVCLSVVTRTQVRYWQNSFTIFDRALNVTDNNYISYDGRGHAYGNIGNYQQAIKDYDKVLEIKPDYEGTYISRSRAYANLGNTMQADEDMKAAARLGNEYAQNNLKGRGIAW
jgi:hypothetical protein